MTQNFLVIHIFKKVILITQPNIFKIIFQHVISVSQLFDFFVCIRASRSSVHFVFITHLNLDQPHFKCIILACAGGCHIGWYSPGTPEPSCLLFQNA